MKKSRSKTKSKLNLKLVKKQQTMQSQSPTNYQVKLPLMKKSSSVSKRDQFNYTSGVFYRPEENREQQMEDQDGFLIPEYEPYQNQSQSFKSIGVHSFQSTAYTTQQHIDQLLKMPIPQLPDKNLAQQLVTQIEKQKKATTLYQQHKNNSQRMKKPPKGLMPNHGQTKMIIEELLTSKDGSLIIRDQPSPHRRLEISRQNSQRSLLSNTITEELQIQSQKNGAPDHHENKNENEDAKQEEIKTNELIFRHNHQLDKRSFGSKRQSDGRNIQRKRELVKSYSTNIPQENNIAEEGSENEEFHRQHSQEVNQFNYFTGQNQVVTQGPPQQSQQDNTSQQLNQKSTKQPSSGETPQQTSPRFKTEVATVRNFDSNEGDENANIAFIRSPENPININGSTPRVNETSTPRTSTGIVSIKHNPLKLPSHSSQHDGGSGGTGRSQIEQATNENVVIILDNSQRGNYSPIGLDNNQKKTQIIEITEEQSFSDEEKSKDVTPKAMNMSDSKSDEEFILSKQDTFGFINDRALEKQRTKQQPIEEKSLVNSIIKQIEQIQEKNSSIAEFDDMVSKQLNMTVDSYNLAVWDKSLIKHIDVPRFELQEKLQAPKLDSISIQFPKNLNGFSKAYEFQHLTQKYDNKSEQESFVLEESIAISPSKMESPDINESAVTEQPIDTVGEVELFLRNIEEEMMFENKIHNCELKFMMNEQFKSVHSVSSEKQPGFTFQAIQINESQDISPNQFDEQPISLIKRDNSTKSRLFMPKRKGSMLGLMQNNHQDFKSINSFAKDMEGFIAEKKSLDGLKEEEDDFDLEDDNEDEDESIDLISLDDSGSFLSAEIYRHEKKIKIIELQNLIEIEHEMQNRYDFRTIRPVQTRTINAYKEELNKLTLDLIEGEKGQDLLNYLTKFRVHFVFIKFSQHDALINLQNSRYTQMAKKARENSGSQGGSTMQNARGFEKPKQEKTKLLFKANAEIDGFLQKYLIQKQNVLRHEDYRTETLTESFLVSKVKARYKLKSIITDWSKFDSKIEQIFENIEKREKFQQICNITVFKQSQILEIDGIQGIFYLVEKRLHKNDVILQQLINRTIFIDYQKIQNMYVKKLNQRIEKDTKALFAARWSELDEEQIKYNMFSRNQFISSILQKLFKRSHFMRTEITQVIFDANNNPVTLLAYDIYRGDQIKTKIVQAYQLQGTYLEMIEPKKTIYITKGQFKVKQFELLRQEHQVLENIYIHPYKYRLTNKVHYEESIYSFSFYSVLFARIKRDKASTQSKKEKRKLKLAEMRERSKTSYQDDKNKKLKFKSNKKNFKHKIKKQENLFKGFEPSVDQLIGHENQKLPTSKIIIEIMPPSQFKRPQKPVIESKLDMISEYSDEGDIPFIKISAMTNLFGMKKQKPQQSDNFQFSQQSMMLQSMSLQIPKSKKMQTLKQTSIELLAQKGIKRSDSKQRESIVEIISDTEIEQRPIEQEQLTQSLIKQKQKNAKKVVHHLSKISQWLKEILEKELKSISNREVKKMIKATKKQISMQLDLSQVPVNFEHPIFSPIIKDFRESMMNIVLKNNKVVSEKISIMKDIPGDATPTFKQRKEDPRAYNFHNTMPRGLHPDDKLKDGDYVSPIQKKQNVIISALTEKVTQAHSVVRNRITIRDRHWKKILHVHRVKFLNEYEIEQRRLLNLKLIQQIKLLSKSLGISLVDKTKKLKGKRHLRFIISQIKRLIIHLKIVRAFEREAQHTITLKRRFEIEQKKLFTAIIQNQIKHVSEFVQFHPNMVNFQNEDGYTMLMYAAYYGRADIVRALLLNGANPNIMNSKNKQTALHIAIEQGFKRVQDVLLEEGDTDEAIKNKQGLTAWQCGYQIYQKTGN